MANKFDKLKNKFDSLRDKLNKSREQAESGGSSTQDFKFKPTLPGNKPKATYTVRILPNVHSENVYPWVEGLYHMFRNPAGKFVYQLCPHTFDKGNGCPICEKAKKLFDSKDQMDEKEARDLYHKRRYFVNVLVKEDPRSGEESQEGKVLVWEVGKQIHEKFIDMIVEQEKNFFHPTEGHDFKFIIKKKGEYPDYTSSYFVGDESEIDDDVDRANEVFDAIWNLEEKILGRGTKSYDELKSLMLGEVVNEAEKKEDIVTDDDDEEEEEVVEEKPKAKKTKKKEKVPSDDDDDPDFEDFDDFDDDDLDFD